MKEPKIRIKKRNLDLEKVRFLEVLGRNMGMVYQSCKIAGIPYSVHKKWLETDSVYAKNVEYIENMTVDYAEATLLSLIKDKNPQATMFYLKTKGAKRGYIEKDDSAKQIIESTPAEDLTKEQKRDVIRKLLSSKVEDAQKEEN